MKLKKYLQFIKESKEVESLNFWKLDEDEIREYLVELTDANYLVTVTFGFLGTEKTYVRNKGYEEEEVFTEKVLSGEKINPAYWIQIEHSRHSTKEDLTHALKFAVDIISDTADAECRLQDDGGVLDINPIEVKDGLFVDGDLEAEKYIAIFAIQKESVQLSEKDLSEFYGWSFDFEKDGKMWIEVDLEDLSDYLLSRNSSYKDYLVKGQEAMWDNYDISDYYPDIISLFQYTLNKDNCKLLVQSIIKELGGYKQAINFIGDECSNEVYEGVKEMSEEELVNYLLEERFKSTIKDIGLNTEVMMEVRDTVANWEMSAHCDDNYEEIIHEFDKIVSDEVGYFNKIEKEVTKYYQTKDGEKKEYKTDVTYYQIPHDNKWIEEMDSEDIYGKHLFDIFKEWIENGDHRYELNPRFSDYGNVDSKKMNEDIKSYLNRYLNK